MRAALLAAVLVLAATGVALTAPGDLTFERKGATESYPEAIFEHWRHAIQYRCYVCHPVPFVMETGGSGLTGREMHETSACGRCHNGRVAFNVELQSCNRCHRPLEK